MSRPEFEPLAYKVKREMDAIEQRMCEARGRERVGHDGTVLFASKPIEWERRGECMIVTSHKPDFKGYIEVSINGKRNRLHRHVCERRHGPLGDSLARHTCDNPACINPNHIIPGTPKQNSQDMVSRDRSMRGERSHSAKLIASQVLEIRAITGMTHQAIADRYGISCAHVTGIKQRRFWKHLPETPQKKAVRCAWCSPKPTTIDLSVSHGICDPCKAKALADVGK